MVLSSRKSPAIPPNLPGLDISEYIQHPASRAWANHNVGITGRFPPHTQAEIKAAMAYHGATTVDGMYKYIRYLIWDGRTYSRKLRLALQFGTVIIDHNWLVNETKKSAPATLPATTARSTQAMAQRVVNRNSNAVDAQYHLPI